MDEALTAIEVAKARLPTLTATGIDISVGHDEFSVANIATAIAFLRLCRKIKTPTYSSYFLKHVAERWGGHNGMQPYITNGELIVAAVYLGFHIEPIRRSPNACVGVSRIDVKKWWNELRRPTT